MSNNNPIFNKFDIARHESYRFIGKSIYIGNKDSFGCFDSLRDYLWEHSNGIFTAIESLKEHATAEIHNAALVSWDRCDSKPTENGDSYIGLYAFGKTEGIQ